MPDIRPVAGLFFGASVDSEDDGLPDAEAGQDGSGGDDNDNQSDEDGVFVLTDAVASTGTANTAAFLVNASAAGLVNGWIDFNQDGDWDDVGERIFTNVSVLAGDTALPYTIPAGATPGDTGHDFVFQRRSLPAQQTRHRWRSRRLHRHDS